MTSEATADAYVWVWLPGHTDPVVAGRLSQSPLGLQFNYGRSYLGRSNAIPLYLPELPLQSGVLALPTGLDAPGYLRDAVPDAWGRRIILQRLRDARSHSDTIKIGELTYWLESGSDRIGAVDFQMSPTQYTARESPDAKFHELLDSAERIDQGLSLSPALSLALQLSASVGGVRPKVTFTHGKNKLIAKFSSSTDPDAVVKWEFLAMRLARLAGLDVSPVRLERASGKDVLLVKRFDREATADGRWCRRAVVSAQTLLGLTETVAALASYQDLAEIVRHRFKEPRKSLRELYSRVCFNILCGNTDDHPRNHAAFWDGRDLALTPAFDLCPQHRARSEATQAMKIMGNNRSSQLSACVSVAPHFLLSESEARGIIDSQAACIRTHWDRTCDEAGLGVADRQALWQRQFLNPFAFVGWIFRPKRSQCSGACEAAIPEHVKPAFRRM